MSMGGKEKVSRILGVEVSRERRTKAQRGRGAKLKPNSNQESIRSRYRRQSSKVTKALSEKIG